LKFDISEPFFKDLQKYQFLKNKPLGKAKTCPILSDKKMIEFQWLIKERLRADTKSIF